MVKVLDAILNPVGIYTDLFPVPLSIPPWKRISHSNQQLDNIPPFVLSVLAVLFALYLVEYFPPRCCRQFFGVFAGWQNAGNSAGKKGHIINKSSQELSLPLDCNERISPRSVLYGSYFARSVPGRAPLGDIQPVWPVRPN